MANPFKMSDDTAQDALEQIVDSHGIQNVVRMLETICQLKAEHVASNWQDDALASAWEENAFKIGLMADGLAEVE